MIGELEAAVDFYVWLDQFRKEPPMTLAGFRDLQSEYRAATIEVQDSWDALADMIDLGSDEVDGKAWTDAVERNDRAVAACRAMEKEFGAALLVPQHGPDETRD